MGIGSVFKKIGKGIAKGALTGGKVLSAIDDIPGAKTAVAMIPVAGPALAMAIEKCDLVEDVITEPGSGEKKKQWVRNKLAAELRKHGIEEKYIDDVVSVAFLVKEGIGVVASGDVEEPEKNKSKNGGGGKRGGSSKKSPRSGSASK